MRGVRIAALGHYAPPTRVANDVIEARLGLESGWIERRTGIHARHYAGEGEALSDLAVAAGEMALANAGIERKDVALVLLATSTPDHLLPPSAPLVAHRLGLANAGGIDLAGACGGFVYALSLADGFVRTQDAPVLVIAANMLSRRINPEDRASSVLFADAAGAALLVASENPLEGLAGVHLAAKGSRYDLIHIPGGGSRKPFSAIEDPRETLMVINDGQAVFSEAIAMMTNCARLAMQKAALDMTAVSRLIPHQANLRMMDKVTHRLRIPANRLLSSIAEFANSSAATIPLTLSIDVTERPLTRGEILLMTAAGAGLTGGALAWRC